MATCSDIVDGEDYDDKWRGKGGMATMTTTLTTTHVRRLFRVTAVHVSLLAYVHMHCAAAWTCYRLIIRLIACLMR